MEESAFKFDPEWSGHEASLPLEMRPCKSQDLTPILLIKLQEGRSFFGISALTRRSVEQSRLLVG